MDIDYSVGSYYGANSATPFVAKMGMAAIVRLEGLHLRCVGLDPKRARADPRLCNHFNIGRRALSICLALSSHYPRLFLSGECRSLPVAGIQYEIWRNKDKKARLTTRKTSR